MKNIRFVYFGSSQFSKYVLDELERAGFSPVLSITSAKNPLNLEELRKVNADVFVVASFGKILPKELIYMPEFKTLNVHPSLLPRLRGPSPIQSAILAEEETGVTIMRMDEKMDTGPILAREKVSLEPWPDYYPQVEEKLGRAGGKLLATILPKWISNELKEIPQDDAEATYTKMFKKSDGLIDLQNGPENNLRKIMAFSVWPGAYFFFERKDGKKIRINIIKAEVKDGELKLLRVIPEGKKEMDWESFLRGNR